MKQVKVYYQTVTPESAAFGDFADMGAHDFIKVGKECPIIELVQDLLMDYGSFEASSSQFHKGIWYTTKNSYQDYIDGSQTNYTIHFDGFSEKQQLEIYNRLIGMD